MIETGFLIHLKGIAFPPQRSEGAGVCNEVRRIHIK